MSRGSDLTAGLTIRVGTEGAQTLDGLLKTLDDLAAKGGAIGAISSKAANQNAQQGEAAQRRLEAQTNRIIKDAERQAAAQQKSADKAAAAIIRATEKETNAAQRASEKAHAIVVRAEKDAATKQRILDRDAAKIIAQAERQASAQQKAADRAAAAQIRAAERAEAARQRILDREVAAVIRAADKETKAREKAEARAKAAAERNSFFTGHGMGNRFRQGLAIARDATIAVAGVQMAVAAAGAFVDPAVQFQSAMTDVALKGGLGKAGGMTKAEYDALQASIMAQARGQGAFSPVDAAHASVELAAAGVKGGEVVSALPTTLRFAQSSGLGTGEAAGALVETMSQFGLHVNDFEKIGDVITAAANASTVSVTDMTESLKYAGPISAAANISLEKTSAILALMGERGIKGSAGGTALRTILASLVHPSKQSKDALAALHLTSDDLKAGLNDLPGFFVKLKTAMDNGKFNDAHRLEALKLLFGTEGMTGAQVLLRAATDGTNAWANYTDQMEKAGGTMQEVADTKARTLEGRMRGVEAGFEAAKIQITNGFLPALERMAPAVQTAAGTLADLLTNHGDALGLSAMATVPALILGGPAATAAMTATGLTLGQTLMLGVATGVGTYSATRMVLDAMDDARTPAEKQAGWQEFGEGNTDNQIGAGIFDAIHGTKVLRTGVRGMNAGGTGTGPLSNETLEAMEQERKRREAPVVPFKGSLQIEIINGKPRVVGFRQTGTPLAVGTSVASTPGGM